MNICVQVTLGAYGFISLPWTSGFQALLSVKLSVTVRTLTELILLSNCQQDNLALNLTGLEFYRANNEFYIVKIFFMSDILSY